MDQMTWRTTDLTRWGNSTTNADLTATEIDLNFWILFSSIVALQDHALQDESPIASFSVTGNQMFINMTDGAVLGPFTLPTANWNWTGAWQPNHVYQDFDVFSQGGSLYLVVLAHTSAATFNANANDGLGHDFYALLISAISGVPGGATNGQVLAFLNGAPNWENLTRNLAVFIQGTVTGPNELVFQYSVPEAMHFPAGLAGSQTTSGVNPVAQQNFTMYKNGNSIGIIQFAAATSAATFSFSSQVSFVAGDVITIVGPPAPDGSHANISISLVATLP